MKVWCSLAFVQKPISTESASMGDISFACLVSFDSAEN